MYLQYASEKLKADPELVKIAVAHNGYALQFAAETVKADPEVVKIAVAQQGWALGYAADSLKADPEVVQRDEQPTIFEAFNFFIKKLFTPLDLCVSSCWVAVFPPSSACSRRLKVTITPLRGEGCARKGGGASL